MHWQILQPSELQSPHTRSSQDYGQIQARTGEIPTLDDALQELLENYKKKSRK